MAIKYVRKLGNQLEVVETNNNRTLAYPIGAQMWLAGGSGSGPGPGTGEFVSPFSLEEDVEGSFAEYGPRDGTRFHEGIDFAGGLVGGVGTPIKIAGDGVVDQRYYHNNFGNMLIADHGLMSSGTYQGKRVKTLYAHMVSASPLNPGNKTVAGVTVAGGVGNTGASFGAHLHWEVHVMDDGSGIVWNTNNDGGFRTAVNPRDFMAEYGAA